MVFGRQLESAKQAFQNTQIDPQYSAVVSLVQQSEKISGAKGFSGKQTLDKAQIAASIRSHDPSLDPAAVDRAAEQLAGKLQGEKARVELFMKVLVSIFCLAAGIYFLVKSSGNPDLTKWASGLIGTVVGYWLA
jgi:predicted transporter